MNSSTDGHENQEHREDIRAALRRRAMFMAVASMSTTAGLALLEAGQRAGSPQMARRALRHLGHAADFYKQAGLGRRSAALVRLIDRCFRAWQQHDESRGAR